MSEETKSLVARLPLEVFGQGKLEVVDELLDPDFIDHNTPIPGCRRAGRA